MTKAVENMKLTDDQKTNLMDFLENKKKLINHGELRDQQFERLDELGFGNGGVVLKVKHKPSELIMARKVILSLSLSLPVSLFACIEDVLGQNNEYYFL